jgi:hypothetical protein
MMNIGLLQLEQVMPLPFQFGTIGPNQPVNDKPIGKFLGRERMPVATRLFPAVFARRHDQGPVWNGHEPDTGETVQHLVRINRKQGR